MATRTFAPQNISLIVVDESAVDVASPGQLKLDLRPSVSGGAKTDLSNVSAQTLTLGDGTSSPALNLVKSDGGTGKLSIKVSATERARFGLTSGEALELVQNDSDGAEVGKLSFNATSGLATFSKGVTLTTGNLTITNGYLVATTLGDYANDGAAATGGVPLKGLYHTSGTVKIRLV